MNRSNTSHDCNLDQSPEERAAAAFVRKLKDEPSAEHIFGQLLSDHTTASSARRIERAWNGIAEHANRPEFLALREQALGYARRANRRRRPWTRVQDSWGRVAAVVGLAVVAGIAWQLSPYGFRGATYETGIGEQRVIELADHSRIALDSNTKLRAILTADTRTIEMTRGQAQFSVTHDPTRPFKVMAGTHTIVAVGTVFTVEYADQIVHVAMMEGKVAIVTPDVSADTPTVNTHELRVRHPAERQADGPSNTIELVAGEEMHFSHDGRAAVTHNADLEVATAWRQGKVIFHSEPLLDAVHRLNRYSPEQLHIEGEGLGALRISGVFEAGDNRSFADAVQAYLPVTADYSRSDVITLRMK